MIASGCSLPLWTPWLLSDPRNQNLGARGLGRCFEGAVPGDGVHPAIEQCLVCSSQLFHGCGNRPRDGKVPGFVGITTLSADTTRRMMFFSRMSHELIPGQSHSRSKFRTGSFQLALIFTWANITCHFSVIFRVCFFFERYFPPHSESE